VRRGINEEIGDTREDSRDDGRSRDIKEA